MQRFYTLTELKTDCDRYSTQLQKVSKKNDTAQKLLGALSALIGACADDVEGVTEDDVEYFRNHKAFELKYIFDTACKNAGIGGKESPIAWILDHLSRTRLHSVLAMYQKDKNFQNNLSRLGYQFELESPEALDNRRQAYFHFNYGMSRSDGA